MHVHYPFFQFDYYTRQSTNILTIHDDVIKWKHFLCFWPFVRGIHWSLMNSPHKGQWCRALMFSLISAWTNSWVNNRDDSDLRHYHTHYVITIMHQERNVSADSTQNHVLHNNGNKLHLGHPHGIHVKHLTYSVLSNNYAWWWWDGMMWWQVYVTLRP